MAKKVTVLTSVSLALLITAAVRARPPVNVADRRQVFIDGRLIDKSDGIKLAVHRPHGTGEIVLRCDRPWEERLGQYHSVLKDGDTYHMWYTFYGRADEDSPVVRSIAYARSGDGIQWEKPDLGLVEVYGTRSNNIVLGHGFAGIKGATHGCMVFLDPKAPAEEKFRLVSNPKELGKSLQIFSSADGIHWELTHRNVMAFRSERHHLDTQNVIFWDDRVAKYVAYVRRNQRPTGSQGRSVARTESENLSHFDDVEDCPIVLGFDEKDPTYDDPVSKARVQAVDFYTNGTVKYPWAQDAYYMFPSEYFHYMTFLKDFRKGQPVNAGSLDVRFAASRDGINWTRYDRHAFLDLGMKDDWDSRSIYMAYGIIPGASKRKLFMYYCGSNTLHGWDRDDQHWQRNRRLLTRVGGAPAREESGIGRLIVRRDGFVSAQADYAGGELVTPTLAFNGKRLLLNVDTSAVGQVLVEIQDENGNPLPNFRLEDCDEIYTTNDIDCTVTWNGESSLTGLARRTIRLRFVMRDADLYAFQFSGPI